MEALIIPALGTSAVLAATILVLAWDRRCRRHVAALADLSPRILVTGTRGKSSTVRLLHAVLRAADRAPWGRVTGTVAEELAPTGAIEPVVRTGQHSVLELFATVRRARAAGARSLVVECMAVNPELIALTQRGIIAADVALVTNARADHLEDQGLTPAAIAVSNAAVAEGARVVVTAEHDPEVLATLRAGIGGYGAACVTVHGDWLPAAVRARVPDEHPDNVAAVLAVAALLGIHADTALEAMGSGSHEPLARDPVTDRITVGTTTHTFVNLGSINDPESTRAALDALDPRDTHESPGASSRTGARRPFRIAIVHSRWDRPLRSIEFAAFLERREFDRVLLTGAAYRPMRRILRRQGFARREVRPLRTWSAFTAGALVRRLRRLRPTGPDVLVVQMANVESTTAVRIERALARRRSRPDQVRP